MGRKKTSKLIIGIFVTVGALIVVIAIIWLGASHFLEGGFKCVTYFDESVQGLNPDSTVKYRGVDVGRVEDINVAPDLKLIEVVMKINIRPDQIKQTFSQLKTAGLTGIVFIDLDRKDPKDNTPSFKLTFTPPYDVIDSRPSATKQILDGIDTIISKTKELDLKGISDEFKSVQKAITDFLAGDRTKNIIANIDEMAVHLNRTAKNVDKIVAESGFDETLADTRKAVHDARILIADIKKDFQALKLAETAAKTNNLVDGLDKKTREITADIKMTSENLRQASSNLDLLIQDLQANPSDIIFSKPPPPKTRR